MLASRWRRAGCATLIRGARFVPLDSDNHVLLDTERVWACFLAELQRFLRSATSAAPRSTSPIVALAASMVLGTRLMLPPARAAIGYTAVLPSAVVFWLWGYGVARMRPERAGQVIHLMPVFGPALAMTIRGDTVSMGAGGKGGSCFPRHSHRVPRVANPKRTKLGQVVDMAGGKSF